MTDPARPWWASAAADDTGEGPRGGPGGGRADGKADGVDPVEAFRAARRPRARSEGDRPAEQASARAGQEPEDAWRKAPSEPGAAAGDRVGSDPAGSDGHRPELCGVCPLCTLGRYVEDQHPELAVHLGEAARHLGAALRVLFEPPASPASPRDDGVQRIDLDRDTGDDG